MNAFKLCTWVGRVAFLFWSSTIWSSRIGETQDNEQYQDHAHRTQTSPGTSSGPHHPHDRVRLTAAWPNSVQKMPSSPVITGAFAMVVTTNTPSSSLRQVEAKRTGRSTRSRPFSFLASRKSTRRQSRPPRSRELESVREKSKDRFHSIRGPEKKPLLGLRRGLEPPLTEVDIGRTSSSHRSDDDMIELQLQKAPSFVSLSSSGGANTNAACSIHPNCVSAGFTEGNCCPTDGANGMELKCCSVELLVGDPDVLCSAHPKCAGLRGRCCPTEEGVRLGCCGPKTEVSANVGVKLPTPIVALFPGQVIDTVPAVKVGAPEELSPSLSPTTAWWAWLSKLDDTSPSTAGGCACSNGYVDTAGGRCSFEGQQHCSSCVPGFAPRADWPQRGERGCHPICGECPDDRVDQEAGAVVVKKYLQLHGPAEFCPNILPADMSDLVLSAGVKRREDVRTLCARVCCEENQHTRDSTLETARALKSSSDEVVYNENHQEDQNGNGEANNKHGQEEEEQQLGGGRHADESPPNKGDVDQSCSSTCIGLVLGVSLAIVVFLAVGVIVYNASVSNEEVHPHVRSASSGPVGSSQKAAAVVSAASSFTKLPDHEEDKKKHHRASWGRGSNTAEERLVQEGSAAKPPSTERPSNKDRIGSSVILDGRDNAQHSIGGTGTDDEAVPGSIKFFGFGSQSGACLQQASIGGVAAKRDNQSSSAAEPPQETPQRDRQSAAEEAPAQETPKRESQSAADPPQETPKRDSHDAAAEDSEDLETLTE
ncbi:unnamed protein product [Amoebophrya sp. A120]|nr:unnamed protein product [Amoebophrya sp. A120]|eukprot:GSA120T00003867001.1